MFIVTPKMITKLINKNIAKSKLDLSEEANVGSQLFKRMWVRDELCVVEFLDRLARPEPQVRI